MPKKVSHQERRRLIADALMRVAAERGLEAVSLRHVAAEAGVSMGMVQHYFSTKDEMMIFALNVVSENVEARLASVDLGESPAPGAFVRALLVELLPLDEPRRAEAQVTLAFLAYAAVRPAVAAQVSKDNELLREFVANRIRAAQDAGDVPAGLEPARTAAALLALVEGLGVSVLGGYYTSDTALTIFDSHLNALFNAASA
jgi:AcrR family transcriptional regulator